jgi:hypothetical protein
VAGHFLSHEENELPIALMHTSQQTPELAQDRSILPGTTPGNVGRTLPLGKMGKFRRPLAVIEELIKRHVQRPSHFLQRFDARNGIAVLDTGNVTAKQTRALFNVALRKVLFFAQSAQAVSHDHFAFPLSSVPTTL